MAERRSEAYREALLGSAERAGKLPQGNLGGGAAHPKLYPETTPPPPGGGGGAFKAREQKSAECDTDREAEPECSLKHDRAHVRAHELSRGELAEEHGEGPSGDWEREQRQQCRGLQCARGDECDQDGTSSS